MRLFEIILSLVNLLTLCSLAITRFRATRWLDYAAPAALLVAVVQIVVEGPRWQMVPAYALAIIFCLIGLLKIIRRGGIPINRLFARLGIGLVVLTLLGSIALPIIQSIPERSGQKQDYTQYSPITKKSVANQGIVVTVNEVLADDSKIIINYTIKSNKNNITDLERQKGLLGTPGFLKINGKPASGGSDNTGNYFDDYTYVGCLIFHTVVPQNFEMLNLDLNFNRIMGINGSWNFAFRVPKDGLAKNTTVFYPHKKLDFPYRNVCNVSVDKVIFSPIDTEIFVNGSYKSLKIANSEDSGFEIENWRVFDDKGRELTPLNGYGRAGSCRTYQMFQIEYRFAHMENTPKYLTVIPVEFTSPEIQVELKPINGVYPIELTQGELGKLIINDIKTENNTTSIKFSTEGNYPYFQAESLKIQDDNKKLLNLKQDPISQYGQKPNEFTMICSALDPNKRYWFRSVILDHVEVREDLKFTIELNK